MAGWNWPSDPYIQFGPISASLTALESEYGVEGSAVSAYVTGMATIRQNRSVAYLDYNATAPVRAAVVDAVAETMRVAGNPSSVHTAGREARRVVEVARAQVAALAGARPRDVVFTSGGSEANNAVLKMTGAASLVVSAVEHDSVLAGAATSGLPVFRVGMTADGLIDFASLETALEQAPKPALVSVMLANNEAGMIQPVAEITERAHAHGARCHTDAVQAAGKIPLDFKELGIDYMSLSAHKLGGPQGVGAIVLAPTAPLAPLVAGGGQELGRRSGTENVAGIAGFGVAAVEALAELGDMDRVAALRDRLEAGAVAAAPQARVIGRNTRRLPNTTCLMLPGVRGETQVMHFDLSGVCLSSGSACSSGKVKVSHVLTALGFSEGDAEASIRVSLGHATTEADIDRFLDAWHALVARQSARAQA